MCGSIFKCWAGALVGMGEYTTPAAILHRYAECCLGPVLHTTNHSTFNFLLLQIGLLGSPKVDQGTHQIYAPPKLFSTPLYSTCLRPPACLPPLACLRPPACLVCRHRMEHHLLLPLIPNSQQFPHCTDAAHCVVRFYQKLWKLWLWNLTTHCCGIKPFCYCIHFQ